MTVEDRPTLRDMRDGKTERVWIADLTFRLQRLMDEGWYIRSVQIDPESMGEPGDLTDPGEWYYQVKLGRLLPGEETFP
jgi:hypothetical protein